MLTLRLKSEKGTLKCEYSEMEKLKPSLLIGGMEMLVPEVRQRNKDLLDSWNSSFQPITLSEEAREILNKRFVEWKGQFESHKLLELSGKSTECFEIRYEGNISSADISNRVTKDLIKVLHLKSVPRKYLYVI